MSGTINPSPYGVSQGNYDLALHRADHDLYFHVAATPGKVTLWPINGADKVAQQIKINLLTFFGEWFLDVTWGVPYLEDILVKNPRMASVETILREHINSVPHVTRLVAFGVDWDRRSRTLRIQFEATTDYGPIKDSIKLETTRSV